MNTPTTRAESLSVQRLLERAARGDLRLPRFQRGLKWRLRDNLLLLDSIYRGYPIGTLLFWERAEPAGRVHIGSVAIDAPESRRAWLIIDGQQRISALVGSMLRTDDSADEHALGFDLQHERFVHLSKLARQDPRVVPLPVLVHPERLLAWLAESGVREGLSDAAERAFRASTRLRDYGIAAYVVETEDEGVAQDVFKRLNTGGRKLTRTEVFEAVEPPGSSHGIAQTKAGLRELDFGELPSALVLKSLQAVLGEDITQGFQPKWGKGEREEGWTRTLDALRQTLVFLRREGEVPHSALLPYSLPVPVLARFFARFREPGSRTRVLLKRWLWRGFVHGTHQGESIPLVRQMVAAIADDEDASVTRLLQLVPRNAAPRGLAPKVSLKTARTRTEVLVLLRSQPRSFKTGALVDVVKALNTGSAGKLLAELFPEGSGANTATIANRAIVDGAGPAKVDLAAVEPSAEVFASHRIPFPLPAHPLADRARDLADYIPRVLDSWMGVGESDRVALSSLIEDEDGP